VRKLPLLIAIALATALALAGCPLPNPPAVNSTAPPDGAHDGLGKAPISAAMQAFASDVGALQGALAVARLTDSDRDRALSLLDGIDRRARALRDRPEFHHPVLEQGLPRFVADLEEARFALKKDPPDPGPAKNIAQSCRQCHAVAALQPPTPLRWAAR
jgi:hypothetical protein